MTESSPIQTGTLDRLRTAWNDLYVRSREDGVLVVTPSTFDDLAEAIEGVLSDPPESAVGTKRCMRVHLVNGEIVDGISNGSADLSQHAEEVETFKELLTDMTGSGADKGWQINMGMPGGGWATFPRSSVLWMEFVGFGADPE